MLIMKYLFAIAIGGGLGYLYYKKVGCPSGTCPLTANPYISTSYGALMGLAIAGIV